MVWRILPVWYNLPMSLQKNKKKTFVEGLFSQVSWRPENYSIVEMEQEEEILEVKKPEELSKKEALDSMKKFTHDILGETDEASAVLGDVEIKREKEKAHYQIDFLPSVDILDKYLEDYPHRLKEIKKRKNIKLFVIANEFYDLDNENIFETCFNKEEADLFSKMIKAMNLESHEIWISSFKKEDLEDEKTQELLHLELGFLGPKMLVSLGAVATQFLMQKKIRLSVVQGEYFEYIVEFKDRVKEYTFMPLFHPEYLLINPNMKRKAWEGMKKIMEVL